MLIVSQKKKKKKKKKNLYADRVLRSVGVGVFS